MSQIDRPKVFMKIHRAREEMLVALCDRAIVGRTFQEGDLRIRVSERFYRGTLVDLDECESYLEEATIANFVGEDSVTKAVELGLVREENVVRIQGIPHAQMVRMFL